MNSTKQLGDLIIRINKVLNLSVERELKPYGIGMGQLQILMLFFANTQGTYSQTELVKILDVDKGNISRNVMKLVDKAYLEQDPHNIRAYKLSNKGSLLKEEIVTSFVKINDSMTYGIKDDELSQTLTVMSRISKNLEENL